MSVWALTERNFYHGVIYMHRIVWVMICVLGVGLTGCASYKFSRQWKAAAAREKGCAICGKWAGTWVSEVNGHHGKLRAIIMQNPDGTYRARYHATWAKVLWYNIEATLRPVEKAGEVEPDR